MKYLDDIKQAIRGEVTTEKEDLEYYSTDGGVFELMPSAIVFPRDAVDVANLVKAINAVNLGSDEKVAITARGNGTDQGGGPINHGIILDFMEHMDQILEIGDEHVLVQPGCIFGRLQTELKARGRFIPSYPASIDVSTIGGAVANNAAGEKTVKYGATRRYVEAIQVVLADGTLTWLYPAGPDDVHAKTEKPNLESQIYQQMRALIEQNYDTVHNNHPHVTKESAGYALWEAMRDGKLDLSQVVTGSQGTLCLITAIRMRTAPLPDPAKTVLSVSHYESLEQAGEAAQALHKLGPSALEIVDRNLIELVNKHKPELLEGLLPSTVPAVVLLAEFDDADDGQRTEKLDKAQAIYGQFAFESTTKNDPKEQANLWKLRRSAAAVMWTIPGTKKALPIIEDGTVPPEKLVEFLKRAYEIFAKYELEIAVWGHAGDADLHMQPFMDLTKKPDREKLFKMTDEFYAMVHELGGTAAGEHNDSLMRAPYRPLMFGPEMEALFNQTKAIFDPENIFNPHKKVGVDFNYIKEHLRHEYSIKSLAHLERHEAQKTIDR